ncbi:hypothetical protein KI387_034574, partial [Taxus chinensis]
MASSSATAEESTRTTGRKRARNLVVSVRGLNLPVLRVRPAVSKCVSEVESSNPSAGDSCSGGGCVTSECEEGSSTPNTYSNSEECSTPNTYSNSEECITPKAKECRIAEVLTCPLPPRKRRITCHSLVLPSSVFFSPPDLDLFFLSGYKIS